MNKFSFRARNPEGRTVTVSCQATDEATARQQLTARGYRILADTPAPKGPSPAAPRPAPRRAPRRRARPSYRWRPAAAGLFLLGLAWMAWGLSRGPAVGPVSSERPLELRLQGVRPRGEGALVISFPELPLVLSRPLASLANPYEIKLEVKSARRPTYGLVRCGGEARRFALSGDPLTGQVPAPPAAGR